MEATKGSERLTNDSHSVIDEFIDHYLQKLDFYAHLASLVADQLRSELARRGIRAIVSSRAKDPARLREKLVQRSTRTGNSKRYSTLKDIDADIVDLAGVRVALYFPGDQKKVGQLIEDLFEGTEPVKKFPTEDSERLSKGLLGYIAEHYRVRLRQDRLTSSQRRYAAARVEVQVASVLMHAWAEIDHDLRYKPTQGSPSLDELATLDEVNGLVLTGEIALERLQRLIEARVGIPDSHYQNAYELQEFLSTQMPNLSPGEVGRVNYLFELIKNASIDTPRDLKRYLDQVTEVSGDNPLADQLIDAVTSEDPERYKLFLSVLSKERDVERSREDWTNYNSAIGDFLSRWIKLEQALARLTGTRRTTFSAKLLNPQLSKYGLSEGNVETITWIRNIRNQLVHGQRLLPVSEIKLAGKHIHMILNILADLKGESNQVPDTE